MAGATCKLSDKEQDEREARSFFSNWRLGHLGNNPLKMLGICLTVGFFPEFRRDMLWSIMSPS